ncbi:MAG: Hsp70 family protein, partial [Clostridia bacterium]|nr:Hsp70 family protein [Clostridia bacterium]
AVSVRATPVENRLRYLKRHLNETVILDDREIEINDAITEVIQFCVREANTRLLNDFGETTNWISLAYPVTYTISDRMKLVELAERATLEDGTRVKVISTIAEPAAAALDYLAVQHKTYEDTTILVYDLGGDTFNLTLVAAYPRGHRINGSWTYYNIIDNCSSYDVGGIDFDQALFELLKQKVSATLNGDFLSEREEAHLRDICEETKLELSHCDLSYPVIAHHGETLDISVTRQEFEAQTRTLLMKTVEMTKKIIMENPNYKPEYILLTGGASQMPMVEAALKKYLPDYANKIRMHNPTLAIACGAARYGIPEWREPGLAGIIRLPYEDFLCLPHDIGICLTDGETHTQFIETLALQGTHLPLLSKWHKFTIADDGQPSILLHAYRSTTENPDRYEIERDYEKIMSMSIDRGKPKPGGTVIKARIRIDRKGFLRLEAFRAGHKIGTLTTVTYKPDRY